MRADFGAFLRKAFSWISGGDPLHWNWHFDAIAHTLERVANRDCRRLLISLPPRNGKSKAISIAWVAWMLGHNPKLNFVCVSYSNELSAKLARDCLAIMQSAWYRELFPGTIISTKRSAAYDFETTAGGGRLATSVTGTITGRGGDIIILDDVIKPDEADSETVREAVNEWYKRTLASRLDDKASGAIICVMQRLHQYDLAGTMVETGTFRQLALPAIAEVDEMIRLTRGRTHLRRVGDVLHPQRESRELLDEIRAEMGSRAFAAQYQQNPVPALGNILKRDWLRYYGPIGTAPGGTIVQSWDTASKAGLENDWSVCVTAFSWSAYRTLVYDVAFRAPAEMASDISRPAGLPGTGGGLVARLDQADRAFISLQMLGTGAGSVSPASTLQAGTTPSQSASAFDPFALGGARVFYLISALGAFAGMRLIAGLMLGLGPFFIGFLLFDSTRGLFEGWIRVLAGAALGAIGTAIILGVQLALLEPRLAELVAWRSAGYAVPGAAAELLVISLVFALANLAMLIGAWRLTGGFAFPALWRSTLSRVADNLGGGEKGEPVVRTVLAPAAGGRSRAVALAESITTISRREAPDSAGLEDRFQRIAQPHASRVEDPPRESARPLGQGGRRTAGRVSASARRRDGR